MGRRTAKLRRMQLDRFFETHLRDFDRKPPKQGWIREIREALSMSMSDLALRMGVTKQRVERMERDEVAEKLTLETMKRVSETLDCEFVYFLVPRKSLNTQMEQQALAAAKKIAAEVDTTMKLEQQGATPAGMKQLIRDTAQDLLEKEDRRIWKLTK
jgi:predicted DNA-binding mobile mystery protein A